MKITLVKIKWELQYTMKVARLFKICGSINVFISWFENPIMTLQGGVKMLYRSMFPISSLAMSIILSHNSEDSINDWESQNMFSSLYVWSEIIPTDHINWNNPKWSWKSSVRAFPTFITDILVCQFFLLVMQNGYLIFILNRKRTLPCNPLD